MNSQPTDQRLDMTLAPLSERGSLADDVRDGLTRAAKTLPPKHLYDARGCELFDDICTLEEYYPTRTEQAILTAEAASIVTASGATELVELGAGSATKTRVLLDAMQAADSLDRYVPFDIAEAAVRPTAEAILAEYPQLDSVHGVVGDFSSDLDLIPEPQSDAPRLVALLGSTIGNFVGEERRELLAGISRMLRPQDHLLLGADLVKDPAVLEAAYNDSRGVTAEFDLNMLTVINRELGGDIPVANFSHHAHFDRDREWIEMRLRADQACHARLEAIDLDIDFSAGEEVRTEISAKFTPQRLTADLGAVGLELSMLYSDPDKLFALALARPTAGRGPTVRSGGANHLMRALADARGRTLAIIAALDAETLEQVHSPLLSPLVWDLGHIAAFEDLWVSRTFGCAMLEPELIAVYDADETPRRDRGTLPFLRTEAAHDYLRRMRARTLGLLAGATPENCEKRLELIVRHELQHNETMLQTLQIAGLATGLAEALDVTLEVDDGLELIPLAGGSLWIGAAGSAGFSYDNEQPRQRMELPPFQIGRSPVSNAAWQEFIEAGGYGRRELWSEAGWNWRTAENVERPLFWNVDGSTTSFGRRRAINPAEAVRHISCFEAEAFVAHHGVRLPTEFEWEAAATIEPQGPEQLLHGLRHTVWHWTSTEFRGYPGFRPDPYPEYSEQFFGHGYRVLRGGAWLSSARVVTTQFRNWDLPERRQIFSGLRIAADA
jgi:L-histidine N-alpha-methyltransferase